MNARACPSQIVAGLQKSRVVHPIGMHEKWRSSTSRGPHTKM